MMNLKFIKIIKSFRKIIVCNQFVNDLIVKKAFNEKIVQSLMETLIKFIFSIVKKIKK